MVDRGSAVRLRGTESAGPVDITITMKCSQCGADNRSGRRYCGACGAGLDIVCPTCRFHNSLADRFCGGCGARLDELAPEEARDESPPPGSPDASLRAYPRVVRPESHEPERRQLTVMFCDLVGSTALSQDLDPEDLRDLIRTYQSTCVEIMEGLEGFVARYMGDGIMVYFGYPEAHEDDPERAVRVALGIVRAMSAGTGDAGGLSPELAVRIGIATGLVVVGDLIGDSAAEELAVIGSAPNMAARLQSLARPNRIVIGETTKRLVAGLFDLNDLGPQNLKGVSEAAPAFEVLAERDVPSRFEAHVARGLTPLIGRDHELRSILGGWEQAVAGNGQAVMITGEAGIGKSRLLRAIRDRCAGERLPYEEILYSCSPYYRNTALYPAIMQLDRAAELGAESDNDAKLDRIEALARRYRLEPRELTPLLATMLSVPLENRYSAPDLSPQQLRERELEAVRGFLVAAATERPVLMVVEDLHWIDPTTLELLDQIVEAVPGIRMLLLTTARTEFNHRWRDPTTVRSISLPRLASQTVTELVAGVAGDRELPDDVVAEIIAKTDGVPLFIEELTRTVLEFGASDGAGDRASATESGPALAIPESLKDSLTARLDRLGDAKPVAQVAATIGRRLSLALLSAVWDRTRPELEEGLKRLVEAVLLYPHGRFPNISFEFKHAMIQETAYESLLKPTRQRYHRRIASVLEDRFPEMVEITPELIAHHYTEAGVVEAGVRYWQRAGEREITRAATVESYRHLERGLALACSLPDGETRTKLELGLQLDLGVAYRGGKGFASAEALAAYSRARELAEALGDTESLTHALRGLWAYHYVGGELHAARTLAEELTHIAQRAGEPSARCISHYTLGSNLFWLGEFETAKWHLETAIEAYQPEQHQTSVSSAQLDPGAMALNNLAWTLWFLGRPDDALEKAKAALALARELAHPFTLGACFVWTAFVHSCRREWEPALAATEELNALGSKHQIAYWPIIGSVQRGRALVARGEIDAGIDAMRIGVEQYRSTGSRVVLAYLLGLLAEGLVEAQRGRSLGGRASSTPGRALRARCHGRDLLSGIPGAQPQSARSSPRVARRREPRPARPARSRLDRNRRRHASGQRRRRNRAGRRYRGFTRGGGDD